TDEPNKYPRNTDWPAGLTIRHRDELDEVQIELAKIPGCTVLIYDQTCAAEKRRRRKRGTYPDPDKRVIINELVCEGCGDCGVVSSHLRIAKSPEDIHAIRVAAASAELVLGGDVVVAGSKKVLAAAKTGKTDMVINVAEFLPGDFTRNVDFTIPTERLKRAIE